MAPAMRYEKARDILQQSFGEIAGAEHIPSNAALGRIAAEEIISPLDLPHSANAAVDGYAFQSQDTEGGDIVSLRIIGMAKAGHPFKGRLQLGEAVRVFTGALMPEGADCALMEEFCIQSDGFVQITQPVKAGRNLRPAGENLHKGEVIIEKGDRLKPSHIGQLAAAGITSLSVKKPLKVAVISTGDELIETGEALSRGHIYDSNRPMLCSLIATSGHEAVDYGIIEDDEEALLSVMSHALAECDIVITSGGASAGIEDHTQTVLKRMNAKSLFWRLAIKPGRPMAAAQKDNKPIFCLPGNPVAVQVCFALFVEPVMNQLSSGQFPPLSSLYVTGDFHHKKPANERAEFIRVKLALTNEGETVMLPHGRKGAGVLSSLTGADGLAELPFGASDITPGCRLRFIALS